MIPNTLFPGRPDYVGPTVGWFGMLHHDDLVEYSHDVMERVAYVKRNKPKNEVAIRLHNMIYLGDRGEAYAAKRADYAAKRAPLDADYKAKLNALYADYAAKREALDDDYAAKLDALRADYVAKLNALRADYKAKLNALYADYAAKRAPLRADYEAKRTAGLAKILDYIKTEIPDYAWDGHQLVF